MQASYSKIQLYRSCPKQYEYAYIKVMPRAISRSESYGSSIHNALKRWGELELQHQSPTKADAQLTMFAEEPVALTELNLETLLQFWHEAFIRSTYTNATEAAEDEQKGVRALTHFFEWWQQTTRQVLTVETGFALELNGHKVKGRFDRIEQSSSGLHIIDFKTGKPREQQIVDEDLQLSVYVQAAKQLWNMPVADVSLLFINEDQTIEVHSTRSAEQLQQATDALNVSITGIEHNEFAPTPSVKTCGYCPYKNVCSSAMRNEQ